MSPSSAFSMLKTSLPTPPAGESCARASCQQTTPTTGPAAAPVRPPTSHNPPCHRRKQPDRRRRGGTAPGRRTDGSPSPPPAGATKGRERKALLARAAEGEIDILVGTHALIQDGVVLPKQALSIVDEQHRFGVRQRASLSGTVDGMLPHQLGMTATPIPRTLNMVLHGDLDVSVLAERPPGRAPIITERYLGVERSIAYDLVREQVGLGRQVFVICPLVAASAPGAP